jgi:hypothetical protein
MNQTWRCQWQLNKLVATLIWVALIAERLQWRREDADAASTDTSI